MTVVYWHLHHLKLDDWPKFPFRVERRSDRRTSGCCCPLKSAVLPPACGALKSTLHLTCFCCHWPHSRTLSNSFIVEAQSLNTLFIFLFYFFLAFNAMELTYCSVFFLPCIFLHWALRTSAEEGKSDDASTFLCWSSSSPKMQSNTSFKCKWTY